MYRNKKKYLDKLFYWDVLIVSKKQQQQKKTIMAHLNI